MATRHLRQSILPRGAGAVTGPFPGSLPGPLPGAVLGAVLGAFVFLTGCTGPSVDALRDQDGAVGFFGRENAPDVASCLSDRLEDVKAFGSLIIVERHDDDRISVYETSSNTVMSVFDIHPGQWRTRVDVSVRRHLYKGDMRSLYQEITRDCLSSV